MNICIYMYSDCAKTARIFAWCPCHEMIWNEQRIPKAANWHTRDTTPKLKILDNLTISATVSARFAFARRVLACCGPKVRSRTSRTLRYMASLSSLSGRRRMVAWGPAHSRGLQASIIHCKHFLRVWWCIPLQSSCYPLIPDGSVSLLAAKLPMTPSLPSKRPQFHVESCHPNLRVGFKSVSSLDASNRHNMAHFGCVPKGSYVLPPCAPKFSMQTKPPDWTWKMWHRHALPQIVLPSSYKPLCVTSPPPGTSEFKTFQTQRVTNGEGFGPYNGPKWACIMIKTQG